MTALAAAPSTFRLRRRLGSASLLLALGLAVAGCQPEAAEEGAKAEAAPVRAVWVAPVRPAAPDRFAFPGVVRARHDGPLAFRVGGKVAERAVDTGAHVAEGDVIARLDRTDLEAGLRAETAREKAAEAESRRAHEDLTRTLALKDKGHVSQSALDDALSAADAAEQTLKAARESRVLAANQLAYSELRADAAGVVTTVLVEPGEVVTAGQAVVRVAQEAAREIEIAVPETRIGLLDHAVAEVSLWAEPGRSFPARLRELSPQADAATRTFTARFTVDAPAEMLRLGMSATLELQAGTTAPGIAVPLAAVWRGEGVDHVWTAREGDDRVRPVDVRVLRFGKSEAIVDPVTAGALKPGDLVVSMGAHRLDAEMPVRVVREDGASDGPVTVGALK